MGTSECKGNMTYIVVTCDVEKCINPIGHFMLWEAKFSRPGFYMAITSHLAKFRVEEHVGWSCMDGERIGWKFTALRQDEFFFCWQVC